MALTQLTKVDGGGISTTSDYRVGIITASKFVGPFDGTGGNFSGVITATNGVFSGNISAVDGNFSGNVTIGGTLTYEDVTNIDSVGIITAQSDVHVGAGVSAVGVGTFGSLDIGGDIDVDGHTNLDNVSVAGVTTHADNASVKFGTDGDFYINHSGSSLGMLNTTGEVLLRNTGGSLYFDCNQISLRIAAGSQNMLNAAPSGVTLYTSNDAKLATTSSGVSILKDLDVDGHTNLDNVSIAGVTTAAGTLRVGTGHTFHDNGNAQIAGIATVYNQLNIPRFYGSGNPTTQLLTLGSDEIRMYQRWNGSTSTIEFKSTGAFIGHPATGASAPITIQSGSFTRFKFINSNGGSGTYAEFNKAGTGGFVQLYGTGSNNKVLTTDADGVNILRDLDVDGHTNLDNVSVAGVTTFTNNVHLLDNDELQIGGSDGSHDGMKLYHDGSNSYINDTGTGSLILDGSDTIRLRMGGSTKFQTDSNGVIASGTAHRFTSGTSGDCELIIEADSDNNAELDNPRILFRQDGGNDWSAIGTNDNTLEISNSVGSGGILFKTGGTNGYTNATGRWKIDTNGHLLPNTAGAVDIGSATAEIGNVYIADDKRFYAGSDQNISLYHTSSSGINHLVSNPGTMFYHAPTHYFTNPVTNQIYAQFIQNSYCELRHSGNLKFRTSETGIDVTGEVATTQDYPNFRPTLDFNFAAVKKLDPRIEYQRTGPASFVNEFGKVVKVGENVPRFDHDPITKECKGLLIEETETNVAESSEDFDNTTHWEKYGQSVVTNVATAPDGTLTADNIIPSAGSSAARYLYFSNNEFPLATSTTYTTSIFVKKNGLRYFAFQAHDNGSGSGHRAGFDLDNGTVVSGTPNNMGSASGVSASIVEFPNGWFRCILTGTTAGSGSIGRTAFSFSSALDGNASVSAITADGTNGGYVWGHQVEASTYATSYIPTNGSTATRGNEIVRMDGEDFSDLYNEIEGTFVSQHEILKNQSNMGIITFCKDFASAERIELRATAANSALGRFEVVTGSSSIVSLYSGLSHSGFGAGKNNKYAFAFKKDDYAGTVNGVTPSTDTSGNMPTEINSMMIGDTTFGVKSNVYIKRIMYYPKRLPNSQLVTLTS